MSNYHALARHPITGAIEMADWLDDSFGHHIYGVRFPGDETIYRSTPCNEVSLHEAGVEIERLRALATDNLDWGERHMHEKHDGLDEIERLRAALLQIAETPDYYTPHMVRTHARAVLEGEKKS